MLAYGHAGDGNLHVNFLWDDDDDLPRVDRAIERMFRQLDTAADPFCLLSGGAADALAGVSPSRTFPCRRVDNLVLEGLAALAEASGDA